MGKDTVHETAKGILGERRSREEGGSRVRVEG